MCWTGSYPMNYWNLLSCAEVCSTTRVLHFSQNIFKSLKNLSLRKQQYVTFCHLGPVATRSSFSDPLWDPRIVKYSLELHFWSAKLSPGWDSLHLTLRWIQSPFLQDSKGNLQPAKPVTPDTFQFIATPTWNIFIPPFPSPYCLQHPCFLSSLPPVLPSSASLPWFSAPCFLPCWSCFYFLCFPPLPLWGHNLEVGKETLNYDISYKAQDRAVKFLIQTTRQPSH